MDIGGDGLYYFKTELPGSEDSADWGPDPEPHIHWDIECTGCAATTAFDGAQPVLCIPGGQTVLKTSNISI